MKKSTIRILLVLGLLLARAAPTTLADGTGLPPLCTSSRPECPKSLAVEQLSGPGLPPLCYPGVPCQLS